MNRKSKLIVAICVFALLLTGAAIGYNRLSQKAKPQVPFQPAKSQQEVSPSPQESENSAETEIVAAPDFTAYDKDGNPVKLSDYHSQPVVLNFWASWCPPCKGEMPHFNTVYSEVKDDVVFLMVDLVDGQKETQAHGQKYIDKNAFTFPVLFDNDQEGAYAYGIRSIPTTLFIDRDGNIAAGVEGAIDEATLRQGIELIR